MQHMLYTDNKNLCDTSSKYITYQNIEIENIIKLNIDCPDCLSRIRNSLDREMKIKKEELDNLELSKYKVDSIIMQVNLGKFNAVTERNQK